MQQVTNPNLLARLELKQACEFHPLEDAQVRESVVSRVGRAEGVVPTVVFDLDSTLYDVSHRTFYIVREWANEVGRTAYPQVAPQIARLSRDQVTYSIKDLFQALALDLRHAHVEEAWAHLKDFWWERFFTSSYLPHDRPYAGAVEFAKKLHGMGAKLIYLTGRADGPMRPGTEENLSRDGFPLDAQTQVWMKPQMSDDDLEYKKASAAKLAQLPVVASFENEPRNLVALWNALPQSMHIFVDTVCSDAPAAPVKGVYLLRSYV